MDGMGKGNESWNPIFNSQGGILIFIRLQGGRNPKRLHKKQTVRTFVVTKLLFENAWKR